MTELLTAAQMRAIEQAAIASGQVTGLELMERAGQGVVQAIFEEWPELATSPGRAVVLCGPGNNGGDGFVVARLLKGLGWEVEAYLYGDPDKLPPDARVNYERWGQVGEVGELTAPMVDSAEYVPDLVIDAIFGTGLSRPIPWDLANAVQLYATTFLDGVRVVAVDLPSGVSSDTGRILPVDEGPKEGKRWQKFAPCVVLDASLCVTFHRAKVGHFLNDGPLESGLIRVIDIGLPQHRSASQHEALVCLLNAPTNVGKEQGHKYTHGHALILSGPPGHTGAARLSARGALRIGAGLVTVACAPEALAENAARLDAVMLKPVADAAALAGVLQYTRISALCIGPGLGLGPREAGLVAVALGLPPPPSPSHEGEGGRDPHALGVSSKGKVLPLPLVGRVAAQRPTVLDADALTHLSRDPVLFSALHANCILTPHAGEFARLFPDIAAKLAAPATKGPAYSKVDATREAAARAGCVVLYKGPDTVIADPTGRCAVNAAVYDRAAPWLATAGSGDVLAGFITGLLARGFSPFDAACTGAWLHVECARSFGPGLIAEDLPEELPKVFRALGL